jgi:hypothetical protein
LLGKGGFCAVSEVSMISLQQETGAPADSAPKNTGIDKFKNDGDTLLDEQKFMLLQQDRTFMSEHCLRGQSKSCRYAIKKLHTDCYKDKHRFINGIVDLAIEVKFLSQISHPSIIKLRAISSTTPPGDDKFFIVLDRLYDTLTIRLQKWKQQDHVCNSNWNKLLRGPKRAKEQQCMAFIERISFANDVAGALKYLHSIK